MIPKFFAAAIALVCFTGYASAQSVQVDRQNRTIEISAESSVEVTADLVTITFGYQNYGPTHDAAFADNAKTSAAILKALVAAGCPEKEIATSDLKSGDPAANQDFRNEPQVDRKQRQFLVSQSWTITASPESAQKLLDVAISAGANDVESPDWKLADPGAAETQAYTSALAKARVLADQMAKSFGSRAGALLYASNESRGMRIGIGASTETAEVTATPLKNRPETKLLPQKIEKTGYVRAIFAIE